VATYSTVSSNNSHYTLRLVVTENSTDVSVNTSSVDWALYLDKSSGYNGFSDYTITAYVNLNGSTVLSNSAKRTLYGSSAQSLPLGSGTSYITHNPDGNLTMPFSYSISMDTVPYTPGNVSGSGTMTLTTIPRATTPTIGAVTLGSTVTIGLPRASSGFTHNLEYWFGSIHEDIATGAGYSASWQASLSLAAQIPSSPSGTGTLRCTTYQGTTPIGYKDISFTATVPASVAPTITAKTMAPADAVFSGKYVKGLSKVSYSVTAEPAYGAAITGCTFTFGALTVSGLSGTTGLLPVAGTIQASVTVTDARGHSTRQSFDSVTVYDYAAPSVSETSAFRCNAQGTADGGGAYICAKCAATCAEVGGANTLTLRVRYKPKGGSFSGYTTLTNNTEAVIGGSLQATASYLVEISVADAAGTEKAIEFNIPTDAVTYNMRNGGKGIAFGKYSEKDAFECAMPAEFTGGLKISGTPLADYIYPIGSIYMSIDSANPTTWLGGTWEQIKDTFLLAAGDAHAAGTTGGEETHTLTESELPKMRPRIIAYGNGGGSDYSGSGGDLSFSFNGSTKGYAGYGMYFGGGKAHSIMPPYLAVYMWRRTA
jgi:hypothetical protein